MAWGTSRYLAVVLTVIMVGIIGYLTWTGVMSPAGIGPLGSIVTTPPGWERIDEGAFSLYAPRGTRLRKAESNGVVYGDIVGPNTCLRYAVGARIALLADRRMHPVYAESALVVDGRRAVERKATFSTGEHEEWFPGCGAPLYAGVLFAEPGVTVEGVARTEDERDQLELIFKSIRFRPPG